MKNNGRSKKEKPYGESEKVQNPYRTDYVPVGNIVPPSRVIVSVLTDGSKFLSSRTVRGR